MLVETRVKISKEVDGKIRKSSVIFLTDSVTLIDALAVVINHLNILQHSHLITDADILACKQSSIKEVATQFEGEKSYVATLKDIWIDEVGDEKSLRYKVLLYAADLTECNTRAQQLSREGYDMQIESLTEMDIEYIEPEQDDTDNEDQI